MDPINKYILVGIELWISLYLLITGYLILKRGKKTLGPAVAFGLWLVKLFQGEDRANQRKAEMMTPSKMKNAGRQALFLGILLLFVTILTIFE
jgi:hypothetical protein